MIITLLILFFFIIINSYFEDVFKKKTREVGLIISVILLGINVLFSLQGYSLPGFLELEKFNILKMLFLLVITISLIFDSSKDTVFRKVVTIFLISSNNIEFQATFLLAALVVEKILAGVEINYKYYTTLLLIIMVSLAGVLLGYGQVLIGLIFSIFLLNDELKKVSKPDPIDLLFYSSILLVFVNQVTTSLALAALIIISLLNLLGTGKRLLKYEQDSFSGFLSLVFLFMALLALMGLHQLYYFIGIIIFLGMYCRKNVKTPSIHWDLFFVMFFFSPPFGIGYMSRIEVFESIMAQPGYIFFLVTLFTLILQLITLLIILKSKELFIESIKQFKFRENIKASVFILFSIALSLLFLPENWIEGYGNLFKLKLFPVEDIGKNIFGIGYYLFWVELVVWLSVVFLYFKTSPAFFRRAYFLNVSLSRNITIIKKNELVKPHRFIENRNKYSAKNLVSSLELGENKLSPQYFTLLMLIAFGLILAGMA